MTNLRVPSICSIVMRPPARRRVHAEAEFFVDSLSRHHGTRPRTVDSNLAGYSRAGPPDYSFTYSRRAARCIDSRTERILGDLEKYDRIRVIGILIS